MRFLITIVSRIIWRLRKLIGSQLSPLLHPIDLELSFLLRSILIRRKFAQARKHKGYMHLVAICQVEHLGDIVACEPVVRQVRRQQPHAFIVFALHKQYYTLAQHHPEIDYVLPLACISEWAKFARSGMFDQIIDLNMDGRKCKVCNISWNKLDGDHGITWSNYLAGNSLLSAFSKSAGIQGIPDEAPIVYISGREVDSVNWLNLPQRYVVVHAGRSTAKVKDLPIEIWQRLVQHVNGHWLLPVIEVGVKPTLIGQDDEFNISFCGKLSILESAEVIRRSALYLGTDSGPAHLANAVGAFGIIVIGAYREFERYMPYSGKYADGENCELIYHNGPVAEVDPGRIFAAIDQRLSQGGREFIKDVNAYEQR